MLFKLRTSNWHKKFSNHYPQSLGAFNFTTQGLFYRFEDGRVKKVIFKFFGSKLSKIRRTSDSMNGVLGMVTTNNFTIRSK